MVRINRLEEFESADISPELKVFLTEKYTKLIEKYDLCGMSGMFSVILLSENETEYIADKLLEFSELRNRQPPPAHKTNDAEIF